MTVNLVIPDNRTSLSSPAEQRFAINEGRLALAELVAS